MKTWHFNIEKQSIEIQSSVNFAEKIKDASTVYTILWVKTVKPSLTVHIQSASAVLSLSKKYTEYENVFSVENADILFSHKITDHTIDLNERASLYNSLYNLFNTELEILRTYLNDVLVKGWIQCSVSSAETSVLFVLKKNEELHLCVDYQSMNQITIKNRHFLPLISKTLNWLSEAKIFFKLNLKDTYHHIQIKEGNE